MEGPSARHDPDAGEVVLPLRRRFQFAHEPLLDTDVERFAARDSEVRSFADRILNARGGAFLVTGYRGVGKTTFVNHVVGMIRAALETPRNADLRYHRAILLDVHLNLPVEYESARLMHLIVRRLYERLCELNVLELLEPGLRREIELAYNRTSFNLAHKRTEAVDLSIGNSIGVEGLGLKLGFKSPVAGKRKRSSVYEASFLGYDERAAEGDIINLGRRLTRGEFARRKSLIARLRGNGVRKTPEIYTLRIMFIFDELDKLEYTHANGSAAESCLPVEQHLRTLKSLFTTSGFTFIFVAGRDMHDYWLHEAAGGDSVFESVFSWDYYVPCLWEETREVCDRVIDLNPLSIPRCKDCLKNYAADEILCTTCGKYLRDRGAAIGAYQRFVKYLCFKGRGIPRLMLRCLHNSVQFREGRPFLVFSQRDLKRHRAFGDLWDRLLAAEDRATYESVYGVRSNVVDRNRLATLYFFDWLLSTGGQLFSKADAEKAVAELSGKIAPDRGLGPMLETALKVGLIELWPEDPDQAQAGEVHRRYILTSRWRIDIGQDPGEGPRSADENYAGNYRFDRLVATGGMSEVHLGFDLAAKRVVVLKLLTSDSEDAQARFRQEISILSRCRHPNVVEFLGAGQLNGHPYLAMEHLEGVELKAILQQPGGLSVGMALAVATPAAAAFAYLHSQRIVRIDIKPSNIMLTREGRVVVIDLGIARMIDDEAFLTKHGVLIGTLPYMAPEQLNGEPASERTDVYSFGAVLYEMLLGNPLVSGSTEAELFQAVRNVRPAEVATGDSALDTLVAQCLNRDPAKRPADIGKVAAALPAPTRSYAAEIRELVRETSQKRHKDSQVSFETTSRYPPYTVTSDAGATRIFCQPLEQLGGQPVETSRRAPARGGVERLEVSSNPVLSRRRPHSAVDVTRIFRGWEATDALRVSDYIAVFGIGMKRLRVPNTLGYVTRLFQGGSVPVTLGAGEYTAMFNRSTINPFLTVLKGPERTGDKLPLKRPRTRIGRAADNDIRLNDACVSRNQAEIVVGLKECWIEDLGGPSPTRVDGVVIQRQQRLADGAQIEIGEFLILYTLNDLAYTGRDGVLESNSAVSE